jgi:hypothetical protein
MSDESKHGQGAAQDDFERQDLSLRPIFISLVALAVVCITVALIVVGVYKVMDRQWAAQQPSANPLVKSGPPDARYATRDQFKQEIQGEFPQPRLEEDERGELNAVRLGEEETLNSYGWVDEKAGVVRIPITRAMELVAQRGLPVLPKGAAAPAEKEAAKKK